MDAGIWIDLANAHLDRSELIARNQIGLVEQHDIGKGKLFLRFVRSIELAQEVLGVDNCYDRSDAIARLEAFSEMAPRRVQESGSRPAGPAFRMIGRSCRCDGQRRCWPIAMGLPLASPTARDASLQAGVQARISAAIL
jgi:hypothetical protein